MIALVAALVVAALALAVAAFLVGRRAGYHAFLWALESNDAVRRHMLERLAQLEGMRLVGRQ